MPWKIPEVNTLLPYLKGRPVAVGSPLLLQQRGGPYISTQQILQGRFVQLRFCQQLLQLRVLCLELFQPPGIRDGHSCVLRLTIVERRLGDPIPPQRSLALTPASASSAQPRTQTSDRTKSGVTSRTVSQVRHLVALSLTGDVSQWRHLAR